MRARLVGTAIIAIALVAGIALHARGSSTTVSPNALGRLAGGGGDGEPEATLTPGTHPTPAELDAFERA